MRIRNWFTVCPYFGTALGQDKKLRKTECTCHSPKAIYRARHAMSEPVNKPLFSDVRSNFVDFRDDKTKGSVFSPLGQIHDRAHGEHFQKRRQRAVPPEASLFVVRMRMIMVDVIFGAFRPAIVVMKMEIDGRNR